MAKKIKLNESSFKKLMEYVGDEEELGRYDLTDNPYIPEEEIDSVATKITGDSRFDKNNGLEEPEYLGQDINDPGPYSLYKKLNYKN